MTLITRWDPFREFVTLQDRMNRLFRDPRGPEGQDESLTSTAFAPPVDVYEDEHNITLKIEVPGIDEKDIDVLLVDSRHFDFQGDVVLVLVDVHGRSKCGRG